MSYGDFLDLLEHVGRDPSRLIFEDELTSIYNRRFLLGYFEHKVNWEGTEDYPLSLLIIDLDRFKDVNDTLGHEVGDQVLAWLSSLLKEVGGDGALPVRFGGDEFVLVLPKTDRAAAREAADRLLRRTRDRPFRLRDTQVNIPITLSIGYATAPLDAASGRDLYHAADMALLHAKQSGRDRLACATDIDPTETTPGAAMYRLHATGVAGREEELAVASEALRALGHGRSQFVIFEAAEGMGKTTLLETIYDNLADDDNFCVASVVGDEFEDYRPYYLAGRILLALLNRRDDKGAGLLESLSAEEIDHLRYVLPQVGNIQPELPSEDLLRSRRQGILSTLTKLLPHTTNNKPLLLLIDDLQHSDEASLFLLRTLIQSQRLKIFICGSSIEFLHRGGAGDVTPLERFFSAFHRELGIRRVKLRPLGEEDIRDYLREVFPRLQAPQGFEAELARLTEGNPQFLAEIIRKLVMNGRVKFADGEWVIDSIDPGDLPDSMEESVAEKITALDAESRGLIERASTFGERTPVSLLAGSSGLDESRILESLDRAEAVGLVRIGFEGDDTVVRFPGKRVQAISYDAIDPERRKKLHEDLGEYQEGLFQHNQLIAPAVIAHHFDRAANEEKAHRYHQLQLAFNQTVFDPEEAVRFATEILEEEYETEPRLEPSTLQLVPVALRSIMSAVRTIQLYPAESVGINQALHEVKEAFDDILTKNDHVSLAQAQRLLLVNGQRIDVSRYSLLATSFLNLLLRSDLQSVTVRRGVTHDEIKAFLTTLGKLKVESLNNRFWRDFTFQHGLTNIELRQVRYSRLRKVQRRGVPSMAVADDEELRPDELSQVPRVLRALHGAAQTVRLYPLDSFPVLRAIQQVQDSLREILAEHPTLSLSVVDRSLLANGVKLDTSGFEQLASHFVDLLDSSALKSVTFLADVPEQELFGFLSAFKHSPPGGYDSKYWNELTAQEDMTFIAFNLRDYKAGVFENILDSVDVSVGEDDEARSALAERIRAEPLDALRANLPSFGKELVLKGEDNLLRQLVQRLFQEYADEETSTRERTLRACRGLLDGLILGMQHKLADPAADPLLEALTQERDPRLLHEIGSLMHGMANTAIQFSDYDLASRLLMGIQEKQRDLERPDSSGGNRGLSRLLERKPDPTVQQLLKDDLKSGQSARQARAAQVAGSLGRAAIPMLVELIKEERDFRIRLMTAKLLAELGPDAGDQLKRALVTEVTVEQRFRILEIVDTVTTDLRGELAYSFGDVSPKIRRAAFRLFERINDERMIDLVIPLAQDQDASVAKGAIRCIAHLRSPAAARALTGILEETDDEKITIACCQALGELRHPAGIDALDNVLAQRKPPFFRRRWSQQARVTAVMALKQIQHPRAAQVVARHADDSDPRVRMLANFRSK